MLSAYTMNATSAPAVSRSASTSRPPNQKMTTRATEKPNPTEAQKAETIHARRREVSNSSSTASP